MEKKEAGLPVGSAPQATVDGAQTISRAIRALKLIASYADSGIKLTELAKTMQIPKPTAFRLLRALVEEGMLIQDPKNKRYFLGQLVFELGLTATHQFNLRDTCLPILQILSRETGDTSFLFVRSKNDAVCLQRALGHFPIQTPVLPVGSRQPMGVSAGGLALIAGLSDEERANVLESVAPRLEVYGNLTLEVLKTLIEQTQRFGYSHIANHAVPGTSAVGLAILDHTGSPFAAITVATTQSRMTKEHIQAVLPSLQRAVKSITQILQ